MTTMPVHIAADLWRFWRRHCSWWRRRRCWRRGRSRSGLMRSRRSRSSPGSSTSSRRASPSSTRRSRTAPRRSTSGPTSTRRARRSRSCARSSARRSAPCRTTARCRSSAPRALDHARDKLKTLEAGDALQAGGEAVPAWTSGAGCRDETERASEELGTARREFAELLRTLQSNEDFIDELVQIRQAQKALEVIRRLTQDIREASDQLKKLIGGIKPPGA